MNNDNSIIVSIIIPMFNVEKYIETTILSVIEQNFGGCEIICIDDSSTDKTLRIVKNIAMNNSCLKIYANDKNRGVSYCRNLGLSKSEGKYCYFLDADDLLKADFFDVALNLIESNNLDCLLFDSELLCIDEGLGSPNLSFNLPNYEGVILSGSEMVNLLIRNEKYTGSVCRQLWKRESLIGASVKFAEGLLAEDALFSVQAMLRTTRIMLTNTACHIYRRHAGSMSTVSTPEKFISVFKIYCILLEEFYSGNFPEEINDSLTKYLEIRLLQSRRLYFKNRKILSEKCFDNPLEKHLYKELLEGYYKEKHYFSEDEIRYIKQYPCAIMYGAGLVASDILYELSIYNCEPNYIVVTKLNNNSSKIDGRSVCEIGEIMVDKNDTIVIIAASRKNAEEMKANAIFLGYKNIFTPQLYPR